jgi:hypothetical protein
MIIIYMEEAGVENELHHSPDRTTCFKHYFCQIKALAKATLFKHESNNYIGTYCT